MPLRRVKGRETGHPRTCGSPLKTKGLQRYQAGWGRLKGETEQERTVGARY